MSQSVVLQHVEYATLQTELTGNWCGYRSEASGLYGAQGTFNVRFNTTGHQATWVGLGNTGPLLQTGIDGGQGYHDAWIEQLPNDPVPYFAVQQNDIIDASVGLDSGTGLWVASIYDATSSYSAMQAFSGSIDRKGAWIVEKMAGSQLGTFGNITFSNCQWWNAGGTLSNINAGTGYYYEDYIQSGGGTQVWPGSLYNGGNAFSVSRN
jgi:hypothetical protein